MMATTGGLWSDIFVWAIWVRFPKPLAFENYIYVSWEPIAESIGVMSIVKSGSPTLLWVG